MRTIKIAVVGTGWVASQYIRTVLDHPETELYAIVSSSQVRAKQKLAEFNATAHVFTDYAKAVQDPNVDAVVLCAMPDDRPEQTVLAAQNGKHIVMEKPLSMNREALWTMRDALEQWPVRTVASFVLRWVPSMKNTKALIQDDAIGRPFMVNIDYWHHVGPQYGQFRWSKTKQSGGSSILSAGCHAVDAVRYFAGDVEEVTAYSSRTWADTEYEFDPNAVAIFKLRNGGIGKVSSSLECKMPYKFNVHILGEKGTISSLPTNSLRRTTLRQFRRFCPIAAMSRTTLSLKKSTILYNRYDRVKLPVANSTMLINRWSCASRSTSPSPREDR